MCGNQNELDETLVSIVRVVFERAVFIAFENSITPDGDGIIPVDGQVIGVDYSSAMSGGDIVLTWPFPLAKEVASNYLGVEDASQDHIEDAVFELTNMVAGNILNFLLNGDLYNLCVPRRLSSVDHAALYGKRATVFSRKFEPNGLIVEVFSKRHD